MIRSLLALSQGEGALFVAFKLIDIICVGKSGDSQHGCLSVVSLASFVLENVTFQHKVHGNGGNDLR
jgi:hypothetical protein